MFSAAPLGLGLPVGPIDQGMNPLAEVCRPFRADLLRKMVCLERGKDIMRDARGLSFFVHESKMVCLLIKRSLC